MTKLPNDQMTKWPNDPMTQWPNLNLNLSSNFIRAWLRRFPFLLSAKNIKLKSSVAQCLQIKSYNQNQIKSNQIKINIWLVTQIFSVWRYENNFDKNISQKITSFNQWHNAINWFEGILPKYLNIMIVCNFYHW